MSDQPRDRAAHVVPAAVGDAVRVGVGVARLGAEAGTRFASWYLQSSSVATARLVRAALAGESVPHLVHDAVDELRDRARELLGIDGEDPMPTDGPRGQDGATREVVDADTLRRRGAELLRRSADVTYEEPFHPAYARILELLAPDEARILRLLRVHGPQPAVDVRNATALGTSSELLAPGLSMIGDEAGCRYLERVPSYLNNLFRLGLVWFSREPVEDITRYQVLEAQPGVLEALGRARRGRTVRRSVQLTPFGTDFCAICIPCDT